MPQNTPALYSKIISAPKKIQWTDIFAADKVKRNQSDVDYAMIAGTTLDTVNTEIGMLQKWQRPWLYRRVLIVGLVLILVLLAATVALIVLAGFSQFPAINLLMITIPPCVVPISLMIFFWEMNAPRDISLTQMLGYFFVGGVMSLLTTILLYFFVPENSIAPITEEPAKLVISLLLLRQLYRKNHRVFGFSGLALGAAVGAGFAAFESAQYAFNCLPYTPVNMDGINTTAHVILLTGETLLPMLINIIMRNVFAVCGHVLYCAPYACIAALNMEGTGSIWHGVCSVPFWVVFGTSFLCHGVWNELANYGLQAVILGAVAMTVILWSASLYGVRRSFAQLAGRISLGNAAGSAASQLKIQGTHGVHAGVAFSVVHSEILIGSDPSCQLSYPVGLPDIAPLHGKLVVQNGILYLADLGSRGGVFLNGARLTPLTGYPLKHGDRFALGTSGQEFYVD